MTNRLSSLYLAEGPHTASIWERDAGTWKLLTIDGGEAVISYPAASKNYGSLESWAAFWLLVSIGVRHVLLPSDTRDLQ